MTELADIVEFPVADARLAILGAWEALGLPVDSSWEHGSIPSMILEAGAQMWHRESLTAVAMKGMTLGEIATGSMLDAHSRSFYGHTRFGSTPAIWLVQLVCAPGSGPYTITEGSMVITDGDSTYRVSADATTHPEVAPYVLPQTLTSGGSLNLAFVCEEPGSKGSIPSIGAINRLVTTFTGVTVTNTSLLKSGSDRETDVELRRRNSAWWGTRNPLALTRDGYIYYALSADPSVRRVEVIGGNPRGPFSVDVVIASASGQAEPAAVAAVLAKLRGRLLDFIGDALEVRSATPVTPTVTGAVYYYSTFSALAVQGAINDALAAMMRSLRIGGQTFTSFGAHQVLRSQYEKAIMSANIGGQPCVKLAVLTSPAEATTISRDDVVTLGTLTYGTGAIELYQVTE